MEYLKRLLLTLLLIGYAGIQTATAQSDAIMQKFQPSKSLFAGLEKAKIPAEMQELGITTNPFRTANPKAIQYMTNERNANIPGITIYGWVYQETNGNGDAGIVVMTCQNRTALKQLCDHIREQSNVRYMTVDNNLINIWCDIDARQEQMLQEAQIYYREKLGAKVYKTASHEAVKEVNDVTTIAVIEGGIPPAPGEDKNVGLKGDIQPPPESVSSSAIKAVPNRQLVYLYREAETLTGFFDDGTVTMCSDCTYNKKTLEHMRRQPATAVYQVDQDMIAVMASKEAVDATGIDLRKEGWLIKEGKVLVPIKD